QHTMSLWLIFVQLSEHPLPQQKKDLNLKRRSSLIKNAPIGRSLNAENGRQYTQFLRPRFKEDAMRRLPAPGLLILVGLIAMLPAGTAAAKTGLLNIDASPRPLNESEEAIAINPTNPKNIVIATNVGHREAGLDAGMFEAVSFDGGTTWTRKLIGDKDNLGDACCDPTLSFDEFGNLFMSYLFEVENTVPIALSTDGGLTFNLVGNI